MSEQPTLAQLRARVHKERHREIGNWLARRWGRPAAVPGTWLAIRLGLSANQVTLAALIANLVGASAIGTGTPIGFVSGVLILHLAFWLDHVDGQVARWRGTTGLDGVYLDYLMHHAANLALGFALGFGLTMHTGDPRWSLAGFALAAGWAGLSLHNDCRYKAFFQRLKRETHTYRVDGGSGGRPAPPSPWPRRGLGVITWPAFKLCEPHIVLIILSVLGFLTFLAPIAWFQLWRGYVIIAAMLAPTLAFGRISKAVRRSSVEHEFAEWFQPDDPKR